MHSDHSNSHQGEASFWDIEQRRKKTKKGGLGSGNKRHSTVHHSAENWQGDDAVHTGWDIEIHMHVQTQTYEEAHTHVQCVQNPFWPDCDE